MHRSRPVDLVSFLLGGVSLVFFQSLLLSVDVQVCFLTVQMKTKPARRVGSLLNAGPSVCVRRGALVPVGILSFVLSAWVCLGFLLVKRRMW